MERSATRRAAMIIEQRRNDAIMIAESVVERSAPGDCRARRDSARSFTSLRMLRGGGLMGRALDTEA